MILSIGEAIFIKEGKIYFPINQQEGEFSGVLLAIYVLQVERFTDGL